MAALLTLDMVSRQCIRDSLSSPAATCREETKGGCGEMGLSRPLPGHRCCPHRVLWPTQLLVSPSIPQGNPTPQELRANPARAGCTPGTLLSQTQGAEGPSCPGPCPFSLPWSSKLRSTAHQPCGHVRSPSLRPRRGMWFYKELVFSPPVAAAPSHQGLERHRPRGPDDVGLSRADAGAARRRDNADGQGWAKVGLTHPLAVG